MKTKSHLAVDCCTFLLCLWLTNLAGATNYTLMLIAQGSGTVQRNPTNAAYPAGVVVTITANPNAGWYFANWSGSTNSTANPLNVTMNADLVITGNFLAYPTYSVTVVTNGQGAIALSPPGGSYLSNTMVTATATPATGWVFAGWSGATSISADPVSFAVNANGTLTGTFAELPAFDVQPVSVTNQAGSTVGFSAHAVGSAPLSYQWFFSGGSLSTVATNSTLVLTNVSPGQAGSYWIVATNNYGDATSQFASLTLTNAGGPTNMVNSPDEASLRAAIQLGGWVGLGFNGTVTLTDTISITNNVILDAMNVSAVISGGNAVRIFYVANGGSLTATNLTLANGSCLITNGTLGTPADGGAIYNDGGTVTLVACTLTNDNAQSMIYGGLARGGAVFNNGGAVSLFQCVVTNNFVVGGGSFSPEISQQSIGTGLGGAVYNTNGPVTIFGCNVCGNLSQSVLQMDTSQGTGLTMGGAVFQASGSMTIANSSFALNQAVGGAAVRTTYYYASPAYGGAAAVTGGSLSIDHSRFWTNQALGGSAGFSAEAGPAYGGAIYCTAGCTAADSTFSGNQAVAGSMDYNMKGMNGYGGAIYSAGTLELNRCSIYANSTQGGASGGFIGVSTDGGDALGGGIFNAAQLAFTNCTLALNSARAGSGSSYFFGFVGNNGTALGGGVFNSTNATSILMNVTTASNSCTAYGPGYSGTNGLAAGLQIANSSGTVLLHNSIVAGSGTNSNACGLITDDGFNICSDGSASFDSGSSYNYTDPRLAPLGDYGGPTLCLALLPDSPAIDNGDPANFPSTDQRGYVRPFGTGPDMGAYEYGSVASVQPYLNISAAGTNVVLSFAAFPTNSYRLQYSTNLSTWTSLSTNGLISVSTNISQTISHQGFKSVFFRLLVQ